MDTELTELAVAAGSVLIKAATAQGWEAAKKAVLGLWRSHAPAQAETIEAGLDTVHAQLAEASEAEAAEIADDLNGVWLANFKTLLRSHPEAADDMRRVVEHDLAPLVVGDSTQNARDIRQTARAESGGISINSGGNTTIGKIDR